MAESKGVLLAKSMQKHAGRAKEKLLQNLGKVDRTADEIFDEHMSNFHRQQNSASRLQKEFNNYIRCVRAVQTASKSLMEAICEVYENQWTGSEAVRAQVSAIEVLWQDFSHKLGDQVLIPLNTYTAQFPEMKKKIEKRNRKLIDYDGQRHSFQNLQANAAKKKDDVKLTKGREQLEEARRTYELLNTELHDELPALYDSRILFLVTNLQTLFASEQVFHNETSKIYAELEAVVDKLATESQRGSYTLKKITGNSNTSSPPQSPVKAMVNSTTSTPTPSITTTVINNNSYPTPIVNQNGNSNNTISPSSPPSSPSPTSDIDDSPISSLPTSSTLQLHNHNNDNGPSYQNTTSSGFFLKLKHDNNDNENNEKNDNYICIKNDNNDADNNEKDIKYITETTTITKASIESHVEEQKPAILPISNTTTITPSSEPIVVGATANNTVTSSTNDLVNNKTLSINNHNTIGDHLNNGNNVIVHPISAPPTIPTTAMYGNNNNNINNNNNNNNNNNKMEELYDIPVGATTTDLPPGVLYRVKATYRYVKEDVDELSFEVGDTIRVTEYEDPEDAEEGWLMGVKEGTNEKGLFPANFTRPL